MKTSIKNLFRLPLLIIALGFISAFPVTAQTFTTLHSFSASSTNASGAHTNSDGANSYAGLTVAGNGNIRYGTASLGGSSGNGAVFAVNLDGTGFTNLYSFTAGSTNASGDYTNSDGIGPWAGLIVAGNTLYGTAYHGGRFGEGAVFTINTDGSAFTNLHNFTATGASEINDDGAYPNAGLILLGNTLYGTASKGGSSGMGTVFAVKTDGTAFANLHSFTNGPDGAIPVAGLIAFQGVLYGTTSGGGAGRNGTIFAINLDGANFRILHSLQPTQGTGLCFNDVDCLSFPGTQCVNGRCVCRGFCGRLVRQSADWLSEQRAINFEGANPNSALVLSGGTLFGTAADCGSSGFGTVFSLKTDGSAFTVLHTFSGFNDGANPWDALTLSGSTLYGTAYSGGSLGVGTVFALNTDGSSFTSLHSFTGRSDGANPIGGLILTNNSLYGTTEFGGSSENILPFSGQGTVFSVFIEPELTITASETDVVLTWPASYAGLTLQFTTNLGSPTVWTTISPGVIVNGQHTVTKLISGTQQFYRLSQ